MISQHFFLTIRKSQQIFSLTSNTGWNYPPSSIRKAYSIRLKILTGAVKHRIN